MNKWILLHSEEGKLLLRTEDFLWAESRKEGGSILCTKQVEVYTDNHIKYAVKEDVDEILEKMEKPTGLPWVVSPWMQSTTLRESADRRNTIVDLVEKGADSNERDADPQYDESAAQVREPNSGSGKGSSGGSKITERGTEPWE